MRIAKLGVAIQMIQRIGTDVYKRQNIWFQEGVLTCEKRHPWTEDCIDPCEFQSDKQCIIRMGGHEYERK